VVMALLCPEVGLLAIPLLLRLECMACLGLCSITVYI